MITEQFLQFANLVPEPMLLVSTDGIICAANHAVRRQAGWHGEIVGQRLSDWVTDTASEVMRYIQGCARTRNLLPGSLVLRGSDGKTLPCRCDGAVLIPRSASAPALVQLRLLSKVETPSQFFFLNERIIALTTEIAARKRAENNLQKRQAEVEALNLRLQRAIAETHHRVKNNLQAVISLIELQKADAINDVLPIQSINESLFQIKTIALVHDVLSHDGPMNDVDARVVLTNLVDLLSDSLGGAGKHAPLYLQAQSVWLSTQQATALALVVNELISNAFKHGYLPERKQDNDGIYIRFSIRGNEALLEVEDRGIGFPGDFNITIHANLGLALVQSLVENDLQGRIYFGVADPSGPQVDSLGGKVSIRFPAPTRTE